MPSYPKRPAPDDTRGYYISEVCGSRISTSIISRFEDDTPKCANERRFFEHITSNPDAFLSWYDKFVRYTNAAMDELVQSDIKFVLTLMREDNELPDQYSNNNWRGLLARWFNDDNDVDYFEIREGAGETVYNRDLSPTDNARIDADHLIAKLINEASRSGSSLLVEALDDPELIDLIAPDFVERHQDQGGDDHG
ncbi:hypothetical protein V5T82_07335 [Magnetovibrio sp. PR-2]|uniref:hypothetical protein n=1 Tax=Magnetovibrio sp. PR-2 TaxID=3120356 RepID=UPI002FCE3008